MKDTHFISPRNYWCLALLLVFSLSFISKEQKDKDYWNVLALVKLKAMVNENTEFLYLKPEFPLKIKKLEGKLITLEGFLHYSPKEGYLLTRYMSSRGQICSLRPGPREKVSINFTNRAKLETHQFVKISGKLSLNESNPCTSIFYLNEASCVNCKIPKLEISGN